MATNDEDGRDLFCVSCVLQSFQRGLLRTRPELFHLLRTPQQSRTGGVSDRHILILGPVNRSHFPWVPNGRPAGPSGQFLSFCLPVTHRERQSERSEGLSPAQVLGLWLARIASCELAPFLREGDREIRRGSGVYYDRSSGMSRTI